MATPDECREMFDWLVRQMGIKTDSKKDWYEIFEPLSTVEMRAGKSGVLHKESFPPKPAVFLGYAGFVSVTSNASMRFNPCDHWTDDRGREMGGPPGSAPNQSAEPGKGQYTISRAEGAKRISDYLKTIRKVAPINSEHLDG